MSTQAEVLLTTSPVMPVLVIERVEDAVPIAEALKAGGLKVLEVTLRTDSALDVIREIAANVDDVLVGAGTVTRPEEFKLVEEAGGQFAISPGATDALFEAGLESNLPYLPAVSTVAEMMRGMEFGFNCFKFFPAEANGGAPTLKAFSGPFPNVRFCPTGGIGANNFTEYLKLPNVSVVGGSWVVPQNLIDAKDWAGITALAKEAVSKANAL
ncbi:MAG TPA: bifunctional 4-hydroxy-2-oxoglutarate aldolase/2-dehydro-3-deoxy-phosphogluconate aldolase [Marinobacterium sp.]|nr:bifunctional 4-hydroxy-2-oxoglutarate aldolase/2-dehydro-3-deoxy-phosphogluconate aldolase [Marinobacterium sp.]